MNMGRTTLAEKLVKLLFFMLPLLFFIISVYYLYFNVLGKNLAYKTIDDVIVITTNIRDNFVNKKYKDFNNDYIAENRNLLPYEMDIKKTDSQYIIRNKHGCRFTFFESFSNMNERIVYFANYDKPEIYQKIYNGSSAYIIHLTNIKKTECISLAQTNWRRHIPNFLGMEIAYSTSEKPVNGLVNLHNYLLVDNLDEIYSSKDTGVVTRKPLDEKKAKEACDCFGYNCNVSLKFL